MLNRIKNRVENELSRYVRGLDNTPSFRALPPILSKFIKNSILQKGKRVRPSLFVTGYLGFADKPAPGLYRSAISIELIHNFILVHDDIIDKSAARRNTPSMYIRLNNKIARHKHLKCSGRDLAIVVGDIIYAMGIAAFMNIDEDRKRKETALARLIDAAVYTGGGELRELLSCSEKSGNITREEIYKIYDLKTGIYSFVTPLTTGAILAGAEKSELNKLSRLGIFLGRAFQIRDDLADIQSDTRESKKTILTWYAYNNPGKKEKAADFAEKEIAGFVKKAKALCADTNMRKAYKDLLINYSNSLLIKHAQ